MKWFPEFLTDEELTATMKSCLGYMPDDACTYWRGVYNCEDKSYLKEAICEAHNDLASDHGGKSIERREAQINEKSKTVPHYCDSSYDGIVCLESEKDRDTYKLELLKAMRWADYVEWSKRVKEKNQNRGSFFNKTFDSHQMRDKWIQNGMSSVSVPETKSPDDFSTAVFKPLLDAKLLCAIDGKNYINPERFKTLKGFFEAFFAFYGEHKEYARPTESQMKKLYWIRNKDSGELEQVKESTVHNYYSTIS